MYDKTHAKRYKEWKAKRKWYDVRRVLAYIAQIIMIIGIRGGGKTYAWKVKVIDRFLENGEQFVWVRRYLTELEQALKSFFGKVKKDKYLRDKYGEIKYFVKGNNLYINNKLAGIGISLTQAQDFKSSEFPDTYWCIFDEFIAEIGKNRYLKDEVSIWFGLMETIQRNGRVRFVMLGNSVRFNNPYFIHYRIKPFNNGIRYFREKMLLVEMYANKWFIKEKIDSQFGKAVSDSDYFDFGVLNQFRDSGDKFIEKKPNTSVYQCAVKYDGNVFSFYYDRNKNMFYTIRNGIEDKRYVYVFNEKDHDIDYTLVINAKKTLLNGIVNYYKLGRLRFNDMTIREQVMLFLSLIM